PSPIGLRRPTLDPGSDPVADATPTTMATGCGEATVAARAVGGHGRGWGRERGRSDARHRGAAPDVDEPGHDGAHRVEGDERDVGAVAVARAVERLAERQVHGDTAEGADRAGDADERPGPLAGGDPALLLVAAGVEVGPTFLVEDRRDHLV